MRVPASAFSVPALPLLLLLALLAPMAAGQGHDHGGPAGPILLAHDGPPDGRQVVGNLAHFAAIARGADAVPDFHQDLPVRVSLGGRVLFETTASSGHDYDGVNAFDVAFPRAGTYLVEALGPDGQAVASFGGEVVEEPGVPVRIQFDGPSEAAAGESVRFTYSVRARDGDGLVAHSDCWFEVARGGVPVFRTKTHTHEEEQAVDHIFRQEGAHQVRVTCFQAYPTPDATVFKPVVHEADVTVGPRAPTMVPEPVATGPPPTEQNAVVLGKPGGELLLVGTFDPYTVVGPDTMQHLVVAVVDPSSGQPRQHVDFTTTLRGPAGTLFRSQTLHEYDGLYELSTRQALPGVYELDVSADAGGWSDSVVMAYTVAPPAAPTSAGPVTLQLSGTPAAAGLPSQYEAYAEAATGPFAHSEVEVRVLAEGRAAPVLVAKLHTHDDGRFPFALALGEGAHRVEVDGFPLMPEAVLLGGPAVFTLDVPAGTAAQLPETPAEERLAPALPAALLGLGLAAAGRLRRREA